MKKSWQQETSVGSSLALTVMLALIRVLPHIVLVLIAVPVSFFYYIAAGKARKAMREYLDRIELITGRRFNTWKSFLAFSITLIEKCEGWAGKITCRNLRFKTAGVAKFNDTLKTGQGVFLITSHLGSAEELRALAAELSVNELGKQIPVLSLVDFEVTDKFNDMLKKLNPDSMLNLLSVRTISLSSIEQIQTVLDSGGIVIIAGDRSGDKNIDAEFLGSAAAFPFGAFYLPAMLGVPSFFGICVRSSDISFAGSYEVYVEENSTRLEKDSKTARGVFAEQSCRSYVSFLEKYVLQYPYQWYNFYDFWRK